MKTSISLARDDNLPLFHDKLTRAEARLLDPDRNPAEVKANPMNTIVMQRCASTILCGAILLSGCSQELFGFSTWDGSPTMATVQQAERARHEYLNQLSALLVKAPPSALSPAAKISAADILLKFRDLDSVTQMGVSYIEYPRYIREVQFSLNRFQASTQEDAMLRMAFQAGLEPYLEAHTRFAAAIKYRDGTHGRAEHSFYMREHWRIGREAVALLEAHLSSP